MPDQLGAFWIPRRRRQIAAYSAAARPWCCWIVRHSRSGVAGISICRTPNGFSASTIALAIAAGAPIAPASPQPLTPNGLCVQKVACVDALESLAGRYGVELTPADEDPHAAERRRHRERLLELLERAAGFYVRYLWESNEAEPARRYLAERGLEEATLRAFRVGYAPSAWDKLLMAGRREGFANKDIFDAGLAVRSNKGQGRIYDRFRRKNAWRSK